MKLWSLFVVLTIVCWGIYVPMLHHGQKDLGGASRSLWAFLFVGVAYFLVAVLIPLALLAARRELTAFDGSTSGVRLCTLAGVVGAIGALGVILALLYGARPIFVAPVVFAGAPLVNTIVSMIWDKPKEPPHLLFYVGIVLAAAGAGLVLRFKPA
jgi:hypothetical protein